MSARRPRGPVAAAQRPAALLGAALLVAALLASPAGAESPAAPSPSSSPAEPPSSSSSSSFADLRLADQHDEVHTLAPDTTTIVFAADMAGNKIVNALLGARRADYLPGHHAAFVADIHRMPRVITAFFALPRMRTYAYRVLLIDDAALAARFPYRDGEVTVLRLRELRPVATEYAHDAAALARALEGGEAAIHATTLAATPR